MLLSQALPVKKHDPYRRCFERHKGRVKESGAWVCLFRKLLVAMLAKLQSKRARNDYMTWGEIKWGKTDDLNFFYGDDGV